MFDAGQNVVPVYEGWEANPDGSFNLVFGYLKPQLQGAPARPGRRR